MRDLWNLFGTELLIVTIPALLAVAVGATRLRRTGRIHNMRVVARVLIVVISLAAAAMLFSPVATTTHARFLDLHLLATLRHSFASPILFAQMIGNLLLLCWLGFLLPIAFVRVRPWMAAVACLVTSAAIETVQYVIAVGRVTSISDLFFNTIGGTAGAVLAQLVGRRLLTPPVAAPVAAYGNVRS
ncbi:VanZ like family protein [Nakamurella panacisegetis]|uniref:VanZ like family protein n=1 Tax=Nakamurella panacisegetis TaxID=1090615 RepID=A0A1H0KF94_9ACTN|nr:VanZ family protein [Nakamurella panacisegetis]SDO54473.1 VanZ like family protein [Nakamurella panacisegetis]